MNLSSDPKTRSKAPRSELIGIRSQRPNVVFRAARRDACLSSQCNWELPRDESLTWPVLQGGLQYSLKVNAVLVQCPTINVDNHGHSS